MDLPTLVSSEPGIRPVYTIQDHDQRIIPVVVPFNPADNSHADTLIKTNRSCVFGPHFKPELSIALL